MLIWLKDRLNFFNDFANLCQRRVITENFGHIYCFPNVPNLIMFARRSIATDNSMVTHSHASMMLSAVIAEMAVHPCNNMSFIHGMLLGCTWWADTHTFSSFHIVLDRIMAGWLSWLVKMLNTVTLQLVLDHINPVLTLVIIH
jgi:hypothetical protein